MEPNYQAIDEGNRERALALIRERWYTTEMALRGEIVDLSNAEGLIATDASGALVGLLTYRRLGDACEILSLDSLREREGIGSALIERLAALARERGRKRVVLITTNDNLNALRFYQKRGFAMARLYRGALAQSRRLKPEIPLIGEYGIPLRDEIEMERTLDSAKGEP